MKKWVSRQHRLVMLVGAGLLVVGVSFMTAQRVPLYDGIGFPDEPYRYVVAPSPAKRAKLPVHAAQTTGPLQGGTNSNYLQLASDETGPQITIYMPSKSVQTNSGTTVLTLTATPLAPDAHKPAEGQVVGNVYRVVATSDNGDVRFVGSSSNPSFIDLRLPQGYPAGAKVVYRPTPSSPWTSFVTTQIGTDIYQAPLVGFGDYGLIGSKAAPTTTSSNRKPIVLIVAIACFMAAITLAVILIRVRGGDDNSDV